MSDAPVNYKLLTRCGKLHPALCCDRQRLKKENSRVFRILTHIVTFSSHLLRNPRHLIFTVFSAVSTRAVLLCELTLWPGDRCTLKIVLSGPETITSISCANAGGEEFRGERKRNLCWNGDVCCCDVLPYIISFLSNQVAVYHSRSLKRIFFSI